jgi:predicted TIM-barrel fold metal-dependent hydrolase
MEDSVDKLWANSGDSHILEPDDLWQQILPPELARRMPRSEKFDGYEIVHVDGTSFRRDMPKFLTKKDEDDLTIIERNYRPPGARDPRARLLDLDQEGIWGEVVYPSLGIWSNLIKDPELARIAFRANNEWAASEIQGVSPRLVPAAQIPLLSAEDTLAEVEHIIELGLHAVSMPTGVPEGTDDINRDSWEPVWSMAEEAGLIMAFHIGSGVAEHTTFGGPGGAIMNYVESSYSGQRAATKMVSSGALDRHPGLKVLISEAGATWVPFIGDRMEEAYRQHGMFVRPKLSRSPREILFEQVYSSFQHDQSAIAAMTAMGFNNCMFGSDYPHVEGTFGHTQETLHGLFDDVDDAVRLRMTQGAFLDLFPHVGRPPATQDPVYA